MRAWNQNVTRWRPIFARKGEATKTQRNAETDRAYTVKLAESQRDAEIVRGAGDAERNRVFAEAFQKDPEFFAFYRSMQAYAKAWALRAQLW